MIGLLTNRYVLGAVGVTVLLAAALWYRASLIQSGYDRATAEIEAHYAEVARKAEAAYRASERAHTADMATITQRTSDETRALSASVARLTSELRNRPERPAGGPVPTSPTSPVACTGAELYRADALAFAGEAARADRLRIDLADCQARYDSAVKLTND